MSIDSIVNTHEGEHIPKSTAADEARLSTALNKIFDSKENQMSTAEATPTTQDELINTSSEAAAELLKQSGWDIVNELAKVISEGIQTTALVVLPVTANLKEYKAKLTDPAGFETKFNTLRKDIANLSAHMLALFELHKGKEGKPTAEEQPVVDNLTLDYCTLQTHLETAIHPLMLNLVDQLEAVGITDLKIEESENV